MSKIHSESNSQSTDSKNDRFRDPGETRTLNQQNRNLSFYPLNYGTGQGAKVHRQSRFSKLNPPNRRRGPRQAGIFAKVFLISQPISAIHITES